MTERLRAAVITVSDSVSTGTAVDSSGPLAVDLLQQDGHEVQAHDVVADDAARIADLVIAHRRAGIRLLVLTGGTGLGPRDVTPEALAPVLDRTLPGIAEAVRAASRDRVPTTDLSRMTFGTSGSMLVAALPGSPGAVRDGLAVLLPLARHAAAMIEGAGHERVTAARHHVRIAPCIVTTDRLDVASHEAAVTDRSAGAVVTFHGVVRDNDGGRAVERLTYEGHPDAQAVLARTVAATAARFPVTAVAASHRLGAIPIGEAALIVSVSARHRGEAFAACSALVDAIKDALPVWKHQVFADGTDEWVNSA